jgi:hypothetical protein
VKAHSADGLIAWSVPKCAISARGLPYTVSKRSSKFVGILDPTVTQVPFEVEMYCEK